MKKAKKTKHLSSPDGNAAKSAAPDREAIAAIAYSIWEQAGRPEGRELEHWLAAEAQIRHSLGPGAPPA